MGNNYGVFHGFHYDIDMLGNLQHLAERFIIGDDNGIMLISGQSGSGKTTLARSIMTEAERLGKRSKTLTTMEYVDRLMETLNREESPSPLLQDYQAYDLIILEEYDHLSGRLSTQQDVCLHLLNPLLESGKKIIITFIKKPEHSSVISLPTHIRIDLAPADIDVRRAFVRACARDLGVEIDHCTEIYLSAKCPIHAIRANLQHKKLARAI